MKVVFVGHEEPVLTAAREVAAESTDGCFSIREVARELGAKLADAKEALVRLSEWNWCQALDTVAAESLTHDTRWTTLEWSVTHNCEYEVLGISGDYYRILNDYGEPILFHPSGFDIIDDTEPPFWQSRTGEEGERYCGPREWNKPGFFVAFFDRVPEARATFLRVLEERFPETWERAKDAAKHERRKKV